MYSTLLLLYVWVAGDVSLFKNKTFVLKEKCKYKVRIYFYVQREIVSGLKYNQTGYRKGIKGESEATIYIYIYLCIYLYILLCISICVLKIKRTRKNVQEITYLGNHTCCKFYAACVRVKMSESKAVISMCPDPTKTLETPDVCCTVTLALMVAKIKCI